MDNSFNEFSILKAAEEVPSALAVRTEGKDYSFADIAELVKSKEKELEGRGRELFPLVSKPDLETLITIYYLLEKKIPILLIHPGLTQKERETLLSSLDSVSAPLPENAAVILFTSGTTGLPKPAVLTYQALLASARSSAANIRLEPGDIWQMSISPARIGGFSIITRSLASRSALSLPGKFSAERFVRLLEEQSISYASIVPTMLAMILEKYPDWQPPKTLKSLLIGGASASHKLKKRAAQLKIPVILTYAMTETASNIVTTPFDRRFEETSGSGKPNKDVELKIEDGQILVKGPMRMYGYWGKKPLSPDEWMNTGDMGYIDDKGFVHIQARRTDVILSGGENVYPVEVEEALEQIPEIKYARVVGLPDEVWGGIVTALLVPADPAVRLSGAELAARLAPYLAKYKSPRRIAWISELPNLPNGKPDRTPAVLEGLPLETVHYKH